MLPCIFFRQYTVPPFEPSAQIQEADLEILDTSMPPHGQLPGPFTIMAFGQWASLKKHLVQSSSSVVVHFHDVSVTIPVDVVASTPRAPPPLSFPVKYKTPQLVDSTSDESRILSLNTYTHRKICNDWWCMFVSINSYFYVWRRSPWMASTHGSSMVTVVG